MKTAEVPIRYKDRPEGSASKLNTIRDGFRILRMIGMLVKEERPLMFFSCMFALLGLLSIGLMTPVFIEFLETGLVPRLPTAVLSSVIMLLAFLSLACGLILDTVTHSRRELKRLAYLEIKAPKWPESASKRPPFVQGLTLPAGHRVDFGARAENESGHPEPIPQGHLAAS
jgi:hypothetical protein